MVTEQLNVIALMDPYVGKYFSVDYIRQEILGQTEKQIEEMDVQIADDIKSGRAMDPLQLVASDAQALETDQQAAEADIELKQLKPSKH